MPLNRMTLYIINSEKAPLECNSLTRGLTSPNSLLKSSVTLGSIINVSTFNIKNVFITGNNSSKNRTQRSSSLFPLWAHTWRLVGNWLPSPAARKIQPVLHLFTAYHGRKISFRQRWKTLSSTPQYLLKCLSSSSTSKGDSPRCVCKQLRKESTYVRLSDICTLTGSSKQCFLSLQRWGSLSAGWPVKSTACLLHLPVSLASEVQIPPLKSLFNFLYLCFRVSLVWTSFQPFIFFKY